MPIHDFHPELAYSWKSTSIQKIVNFLLDDDEPLLKNWCYGKKGGQGFSRDICKTFHDAPHLSQKLIDGTFGTRWVGYLGSPNMKPGIGILRGTPIRIPNPPGPKTTKPYHWLNTWLVVFTNPFETYAYASTWIKFPHRDPGEHQKMMVKPPPRKFLTNIYLDVRGR